MIFALPISQHCKASARTCVPRAAITAAELQAYARSRLSDFKVPKVIHIVNQLPKDSTGKVERFHLKELLSQ